jgi:hypothetical protein
MDDITTTRYIDYANNIVGTWHNEIPGEVLVFSFLYDYSQQSDLLIIDKGILTETTYCIQNTPGSEWILIIWNEQVNKAAFYYIDALCQDMLVLKNTEHELKIYLKENDNAAHDNALQTI